PMARCGIAKTGPDRRALQPDIVGKGLPTYGMQQVAMHVRIVGRHPMPTMSGGLGAAVCAIFAARDPAAAASPRGRWGIAKTGPGRSALQPDIVGKGLPTYGMQQVAIHVRIVGQHPMPTMSGGVGVNAREVFAAGHPVASPTRGCDAASRKPAWSQCIAA